MLIEEYSFDEEERAKYNILQRAKIHKQNMDKVIKQIQTEIMNQSRTKSFQETRNFAHTFDNSTASATKGNLMTRHDLTSVLFEYSQQMSITMSKDSFDQKEDRFN